LNNLKYIVLPQKDCLFDLLVEKIQNGSNFLQKEAYNFMN